jgi:hypothetical protein
MTSKRRRSSEYERKLAKLDPETQRAIRAAKTDPEDGRNLNQLRRRTTRGTILDFGASDVGYAIEYGPDGQPIDLYDLRFPVPR